MENTARKTGFAADWPDNETRCRPVPLDKVIVGGFLGKYVNQNLDSLLFAFESALFDGFNAKASGNVPDSRSMRLAADSDVYKWLEGASYVLARTGDEELKKVVGNVVSLILTCQDDDGYINTQVPPGTRFDPKINHDLYVAGHFFEAAAAHARATGRKELLQAACRWADYLISEYEKGNSYYGTVGERQHSEYELGFLRLYREAGDPKFLDFTATLARMCKVGPKVIDVHAGAGALHAVRFGYLMSGLADLFMETGDESRYRHLSGIWRELVETRSYVTGAIGSHGETLSTEPFDLPHTRDNPDRTMGETCSSIAMILFSWRMFSITGKSEVYDVIERILYNHVFGALALNGMGSFYYNPMQVIGDLTGKTDHWHVPACTRGMLPEMNKTFCCMPNCRRFIGALPEYVFSYTPGELYVNLYTSSSVQVVSSSGNAMQFSVETGYPHEGKVVVKCSGGSGELTLRLRIPGWCKKADIELPDETTASAGPGTFYDLKREWEEGDTVILKLPMPIRIIEPDPRVEADKNQVVFARGPLVYCLESEDLDFSIEQARVICRPDEVESRCQMKWNKDMFGGVHTISVPGTDGTRDINMTLIPWYCRANRGDDSRWICHIPTDKR